MRDRASERTSEGARTRASVYEVRCARCDVSFPVGTKKCIHCGGRTAPGLPGGSRGVERPSYGESDGGSNEAILGPSPIEPTQESPFSIGDSGLGEARPNDRDLEIPDSPSSLVGFLSRSLGGIIWVLILIGFALTRGC